MNLLIWVVSVLLALAGGYFFGKKGVKIYKIIIERKLIKNALEVISGLRKNKIEIKGKVMEVNKFKVRDLNDKEITIELTPSILKDKK